MSAEIALGVELAKALGVDVDRAYKVVITIESSSLVNVVVAYHTTADKEARLVGLIKRFQLREPT